ncbi:PAS domain S-box-containing protein [Sporomusaceae bacterium BoRhaA]|uniref:ATP-binding protein n=1 Tax=Pelorhabdus rhamnosifermentans TaxID=2772457 RepID=UPI001FE7D080|nr:sensor histidine kinase [Pelorhabdus rhamnosifermentans]MBU2702863.1 PAS domain S-box-containing protein [Pelorhabdus rhamnosifermentans]
MIGTRRLPIHYHIMILTVTLVCLVLVVSGYFAIKNMDQQIEENITKQALNMGRLLASDAFVIRAMQSDHPSASLQPYAERWRITTGASFIVFANMQQIRFTHTIPENIGKPLTDLYREPVLHGEEYVYSGKGSLDPSLRANVPIFNDLGVQIGLVSIGFDLAAMKDQEEQATKLTLYGLFIALAASIVGSILVAGHIKKAIHGLEPYEIASLMQEREATLAALHEGLVSVDKDGRIGLINKEAARVFGINQDSLLGCSFRDLLGSDHLGEVIHTGKALYNQEFRVKDIIIVSNSVPIFVEGQVIGAVFTFRDRTEISRLAEEMTGVHRFVDLLRAQAHEFKNKLHTVSGLIQLGCYEQAVNYIVENASNHQGNFEQLRSQIKDSVTFGLLYGKSNRAEELGIQMTIDPKTSLGILPGSMTSGDLVIILGNLIENAFEAVIDETDKRVRVKIEQVHQLVTIEVENSGPAIASDLGDEIFLRGVSTKGESRGVGLALVSEKVSIHSGKIFYCNQPAGGVLFTVIIPDK